MSFASIEFIFYFLLVFFIGYYFIPLKYKNTFLLVGSIIFYLYSDLKSFPILLVIAIANYYLTIQYKTTLCLLSAILDVIILIVFKVFTDINILGLSFFIFKQIYYCLDLKRYEYVPEEKLVNYLMYSFMFVTVLSGPIVKFGDIKFDLKDRKLDLYNGFTRFILGLIEKVLIADSLSKLYNELSLVNNPSLIINIFTVFIYSLYLYLDFKSYSSMAIGLGKMLGFDFKENFDYPYESLSVSEFYNRWHMSLGRFFKENIYIPLGGNKKGLTRQIINIMLVWLLTGLWHGFNISYILWGVYFGVIISLEKVFWSKYKKINRKIQRVYVLIIVYIGWAIFIGKNIFNFSYILDTSILFYLRNYFMEIIVAIILCTPILRDYLNKKHPLYIDILISVVVIGLFVLSIASILNNSYTPFLYAAF